METTTCTPRECPRRGTSAAASASGATCAATRRWRQPRRAIRPRIRPRRPRRRLGGPEVPRAPAAPRSPPRRSSSPPAERMNGKRDNDGHGLAVVTISDTVITCREDPVVKCRHKPKNVLLYGRVNDPECAFLRTIHTRARADSGAPFA